MAQQIINVGAVANDGTGDGLRTAYIKINENTTELYSRAQTTPPTTLVGAPGNFAGQYAYDQNFFYYCFANYDGSSTIWAEVAQLGNVAVRTVENGTTILTIDNSGGPLTIDVDGTSNVAVFTTSGLTVSNVTTTGVSATTISSSTTIAATGNISGGNLTTLGRISASGNIVSGGTVSGAFLVGDGSQITNLPAGNGGGGGGSFISNGFSNVYIPTLSGNVNVDVGLVSELAIFYPSGLEINGVVQATELAGGITTAAQPNITSVGTLSSLTVSGTTNTSDVSATGNVSAGGNITATGFFLGDGGLLSNISASGSTYGNANVAAFLPTYTGVVTASTVESANIVTSFIDSSDSSEITVTPIMRFESDIIVENEIQGELEGNVRGSLTGDSTGQHFGLVKGIDIYYLSWDFGSIVGTYSNPISWLIDQAGGFDAGSFLSPSATNIDIGPILSVE